MELRQAGPAAFPSWPLSRQYGVVPQSKGQRLWMGPARYQCFRFLAAGVFWKAGEPDATDALQFPGLAVSCKHFVPVFILMALLELLAHLLSA